ncbi:MAG: ABC transporter permease, partial [Chloroflexi bacterium]|nr:ABC transporter permease [Chloroflexota bacterium]
PTPAWGTMVSEGRNYLITSWWVSTLPGIAIVILVLAINVFGEGLRDILDPRMKIE